MKASLQRVWEQVSMYLPVMLMAVLALGTWWLVRNAPQPSLAGLRTEARTEPDYTMQDFSMREFNAQGQMRSEMHGQQARHYPHTDTLEVDQLRSRSVAENGVLTQVSARRGISNGDNSQVQLWGDALVQRWDRVGGTRTMQVEGEFLHAWVYEERVQSHLPVVLTRGENRFVGDSMEYDNLSQTLVLKGRVKGVLNK